MNEKRDEPSTGKQGAESPDSGWWQSTVRGVDRGTISTGQTAKWVRGLGRLLFGDRLGLSLFLGAVLWLGALWRVGIFIQDTVAVANALANVAEGRLALVDSPYSLFLGPQPGIVEVDGTLYGRNYGHVLLALPLLWLLQAGTALVGTKLLLAGAWSLALVAFATQAGTLTGRHEVRTVLSGVALLVFGGNLATASALPDGVLALIALQLSTLFVAAFIAVFLYRLLRRFHGRSVGLAAGLAVVLATPVGFWATIPKRHVLTAGVAVLALYLFAVSRNQPDRRGTLARGGAYVALGLFTTVHPFEAFFLFVVFAVLDFATAPTYSVRSLVVIGVLFALSLVPFFVLNTLISGNPLQSPRILSGSGGIEFGFDPASDGGGTTEPTPDAGTDPSSINSPGNATETPGNATTTPGNATGTATDRAGNGGTATATPSDGGESGANPLMALLATVVGFLGSLLAFVGDLVDRSVAALTQPRRLYHTFVRSGQIPSEVSTISMNVNDYEAIELTLLESLPLAAALVWLPVAALRRVRERVAGAGITTPRRQTDLLAAGFAVVFAFIYLPRLPLHSQITVRYILPVMPLLVYGVARCSVVRRALRDSPQWVIGGYLVTVVAGGLAVTAALSVLDPAIGEAMQFHALVGLATAGAAALVVGGWPLYEDTRVAAVGLALPAGATTVFLLLAKIEYFAYRLPGDDSPQAFVLDVVRVFAELLPIVHT